MNDKTEKQTLPTKAEPTFSQRFTSMVVKEFGDQVGTLALTPYQQRLAQHMFIAIDTQIKNLEVKRLDSGKDTMPIVWSNINMNKLSIDAVHRVELGIDALIPNHMHPIPYYNKRLQKYDLDLRIGYAGKDCYRRKMAIDSPVDIIYELVYENDEFAPIKKGIGQAGETYKFDILKPFDRGEVIGGFGYIVYKDPTKNKLVIVTKADFDKSKGKAQTQTFWGEHPIEMQFKTLVLRTTSKIAIDPEKVNASMMQVEIDEVQEQADRDIDDNANKEAIDIKPENDADFDPLTDAEKDASETEQTPEDDFRPGNKPAF